MTHVLIADDREPERKLLKMLLEFNGYRVTAVGDGVEALAAARSDRPDVIISDVLMPNMDGFVLRHTWMQDAELRSIPFIFYTANLTSREDEHVGTVLGAARYLTKPMEAAVFLRELRTVLQEWAVPSHPRT
jgi:CheY-like chemotaxis protein